MLVSMPSGTTDGAELRLEGQGNAGGQGGAAGDVVFKALVGQLPDSPLLRHVAAAGAISATVLLVVTVLLFH
jgi:hypothetical protein